MKPVVFESDMLTPPTPRCIDPNGALWQLLKLQQHFDALQRHPDTGAVLISCPALLNTICSKVPLMSVLLSLGLGVGKPGPLVKLWDDKFSEAENPADFLIYANGAIQQANAAIAERARFN